MRCWHETSEDADVEVLLALWPRPGHATVSAKSGSLTVPIPGPHLLQVQEVGVHADVEREVVQDRLLGHANVHHLGFPIRGGSHEALHHHLQDGVPQLRLLPEL